MSKPTIATSHTSSLRDAAQAQDQRLPAGLTRAAGWCLLDRRRWDRCSDYKKK
jgi:hypothetical protein